MEIRTRNVNTALSEAMWYLNICGKVEESRNGPVLVSPDPVMTVYSKPLERVLFSHKRDANPYFHLMEALWMLAGRNDVAFVKQFNSRIDKYSDNTTTFHGAYGHRWRKHFGFDQLLYVVEELLQDRGSRRAVLQMWDAADLQMMNGLRWAGGAKDVPCNTAAYFDLRDGVLNVTVTNRSNDAIWGCYGANVVQFSILLEYVAACLNVEVGTYRQFSNNFHVYKNLPNFDDMVPGVDVRDLYSRGLVQHHKLVSVSIAEWNEDLEKFMSDPLGDALYADPFFNYVAAPMASSWADRKSGRNDGSAAAEAIGASDWRTACLDWITRREAAKNV